MGRYMNEFNLENIKTAIVVGGGHGIGLGISQMLAAANRDLKLHVTYRNEQAAAPLLSWAADYPHVMCHQIDPMDEISWNQLRDSNFESKVPLDLLINSVGFLHDDEIKPEKSLRDIDVGQLQKYFAINSCITPLLAKVFLPHFRHKSPSCFAAVSAKVGSIGDNRLGGWYGYRASKAALNMFIKNIDIEFNQRGCKTKVLAIHPGTTITELSKPYIEKTSLKLHSTEETAQNILRVISESTKEDSGSFFSWDVET